MHLSSITEEEKGNALLKMAPSDETNRFSVYTENRIQVKSRIAILRFGFSTYKITENYILLCI